MSLNHKINITNILNILYGCLPLVVIVFAAVHDDIPQCGLTAIYKKRQSILESPNYPNDYPPKTCWDYVVRSPYRCPTKFHIQFLEFSLEVSENCSNDYLAIGVNNDGDDMEILCGQVIGIKKYHTLDGILRLRFYADESPWTTGKGFKILVTRLACEKSDVVREIYNDTEDIVLPPSYLRSSHVNGVNSFQNLSLQEQYQDLPSKPTNLNSGLVYYPQLQPSNNFQPSQALCPQNWITGQLNNVPQIIEQWQSRALLKSANEPLAKQQNGINILPQATVPCCLSAFKQERFYLSSPGFPRTVITSLLPSEKRDCQFQLEKFSQKVCRLRIEFKFFDFGQSYSGNAFAQGNLNTGNIAYNQNDCAEDFLEIDGIRYCGCRTGYYARLIWDFNQKLLRMRMGFSGLPSNGFLLDITQEECLENGQSPNTINGIDSGLNTGVSSLGNQGGIPNTNIQQPNVLPVNPFYNRQQQQQQQQQQFYGQMQPVYQPSVLNPYYPNPYAYNPYMMRQIWPLNRIPSQLHYPQYRGSRNANYKTTKTITEPLTVVETNSTRKEFYYSEDNDQLHNTNWEAQARSTNAENDFDSDVKNEKIFLRNGNRCVFGTSEIFKLLIDPLWLRKPTCYAPQNNFLGNVFG